MKRLAHVTLVMFSLCLMIASYGFAQDEAAATETESAAVAETPAATETEPAAVEEAPAVSEAEAAPAISVVEAKICEGISDREPVASGDVFPGDISVLYCFSRIESDETAEIKHIWYYNDSPVAEVPLNIGASPGWRTFSSKNINPLEKGNWKVEIVSASGQPLKTIQFVIN